MNLTASQLVTAKEAAGDLLEALGLDAYRFEVVPEDDHWRVRLECAVEEGWMSTHISVEGDLLQQSCTNPAVRERLLHAWRETLDTCRKQR